MIYIVLLFLPLLVSAIGGALVTDESSGKRVAGFVLVAIASLGVIIQIVMQIIDPTYYL